MTSQEGTLPAIRALGQPGDLGWVVLAHGEIYNAEFGWDASFEALVARIVADYAANHDPDREAAWIAERNGERVGCIFCVGGDHAGDAATAHARGGDQALLAQLRILLVDPSARGHGLGTRLVDTALAFARGAGYAKARLWTNDPSSQRDASTSSEASHSSTNSDTTALASTSSAKRMSSSCSRCPQAPAPESERLLSARRPTTGTDVRQG
jgi:GNAT superfamily N-acetyltransferase